MENPSYVVGEIKTTGRSIPVISTQWNLQDRIGAMQVRWGLHRYNYRVEPGLYAIGQPDNTSNVFVTANYKLSFDHVRTSLKGLNAWILVLDTKGINVWCAGGKGTFGTEELAKRIQLTNLATLVSHRKIVVPQLGATGISAYKVKEMTGFNVLYGPVRARDIQAWLDAGDKNSPHFRQVRFNLYDRLVLTGVEIAGSMKYLVFASAAFFLLSGFNPGGYSIDLAFNQGISAAVNLSIAYFTGTFIVPVILPWVPFRAFSMKGGFMGLVVSVILIFTAYLQGNVYQKIAWPMMMTAVSSYLSLNFTGSSPITNLSGVMLEVKKSIPVQIGLASAGLLLYLVSLFIN